MRATRCFLVFVSLGVAIALCWTAVRPQAAAVFYTLVVDEVRDLGALYLNSASEARAINENGAIAGTGDNATFGLRRGMFWASPTAAPVNMGHLGGGWSEAWGINDAGVVVGNSYAAGSTVLRGFRWSQSGGMKDLNLIGYTLGTGPVEWFTAKDINNYGHIVGDFSNGNGIAGYFLGLTVAIVPNCSQWGGLIESHARAINDEGYFTGNVLCYSGPALTPYFASVTTMTTFPGGSGDNLTGGYAINASNRVVGTFPATLPTSFERHHAFRWSPSTGYADIHPPDDTESESIAYGINDNGLIVGRKYTDFLNQAFVYSPGIKMKTLPDLCTRSPWTSASEAYAVNNAGWIVGKSKTCAGDYHATLWKVRIVVRGSVGGLQ
jgi:uncharacterized membrane protein